MFAGFTLALNSFATVLGVFVLRWRQPELLRPYRTFLYPLPPLIYLSLTGWTLWFVLINRPVEGLFGLGIIEQAFAEAGWNVTNLAGAGWDAVCECLQSEHHDLIGVTCAGERLRPNLKSAIDRARFMSTNRDIKVLVGGHLFANDRNLVRVVGADGVASDSVSALQAANGLVPVFDEGTGPSR